MNEQEKRGFAAAILETGAAGAGVAADIVPSLAGDILEGAAGIAKLAAYLTRTIGVDATREALGKMKRRVDAGEGRITAEDIAADDAGVDAFIDELFASQG